MAKQPKWNKEETEKLKEMLDDRYSYQKISKILNRSVNGIKGRIVRIKYRPKCLDCDKRINRKGNRLRCGKCVLKRKRIKGMEWYYAHPEFKIARRERMYFGGMREKVIKRDKEKCVDCGMTRQEHYLKFGCDITVDHKNGNGRNAKKQDQDNKLENLQTLCLICHGKKDAKRRIQDWSMCGKLSTKINQIKLI
jgi:cytochrome c553